MGETKAPPAADNNGEDSWTQVSGPFGAAGQTPGRFRRWLHRARSRLGAERSEYRLYPEAAGVGLSSPLQEELDKRCSGLKASWSLAPLALWSEVRRRERLAVVCAAHRQRLFDLTLSDEGVEYLEGWVEELSQLAAPICEWFSEPRPSGEAMAAKHAFLKLDPLAIAFERGEAIEFLWSGFLEEPSDEGLGRLITAAAAEPRLRQLRPYIQMDRLCFSRWFDYPFSNDLPSAMADGAGFRVFRAKELPPYLGGTAVGIAAGDPDHAVKLLVAALPEPLEVTYRRPPGLPAG